MHNHHECVEVVAAFGLWISSDWRVTGAFGLELALLTKSDICLSAIFSTKRYTRKLSQGNVYVTVALCNLFSVLPALTDSQK